MIYHAIVIGSILLVFLGLLPFLKNRGDEYHIEALSKMGYWLRWSDTRYIEHFDLLRHGWEETIIKRNPVEHIILMKLKKSNDDERTKAILEQRAKIIARSEQLKQQTGAIK